MKVELFGKDKKDGVKVWTISAWASVDGNGVVTIEHGKLGGKITRKDEVITVGKQGRSPLEQAVSEAQGKEKKQRDKGYRDTIEELEELPLLAMLAGDYNKIGHRIDWTKPVYGSDKLDGVRCLAKKVNGVVTLESRTGQPYDVPHIVDQLTKFMGEGETLDGELYKHGEILQDITSAVKRTDTQKEIDTSFNRMSKDNSVANADAYDNAIKIAYLRDELEFIIFDALYMDVQGPVTDVRFEDRLTVLLKDIEDDLSSNTFPNIKVIEYTLIESEEHLKNVVHPDAVGRGFEGVMLRNAAGIYESGKRSADLQKYKTFLDSEFQIVDVLQDKDGGAIFTMQNTFADNTFEVVWGTHEQRAQWWMDRGLLVGLWLKVKYQALYKGTLKPQFPVGVEFRACDENGNPVD